MTKETPTGTHTESGVILTFTTLDTNMRCPEGICSNESRLYPDLAYNHSRRLEVLNGYTKETPRFHRHFFSWHYRTLCTFGSYIKVQ